MRLEAYNDKNSRVSITDYEECFPSKQEANSMLKNGYKLKLDGKVMTKKAINELFKK